MTPEFSLASEYASQSLTFVNAAGTHAAKGDQERAKRCLLKFRELLDKCGPTLIALEPQITAAIRGDLETKRSDGTTEHHHSAHGLVIWLWGKIQRAMANSEWSVPAKFGDWLGVDTAMVDFHLHRERSILGNADAPSAEGIAPRTLCPLSENQAMVLLAIRDRHPHRVLQAQIAAAVDLSPKVVGEIVQELVAWGLADMPPGSRKGVAITQDGLAWHETNR